MLKRLWFGLMIIALLYGAAHGRLYAVVISIPQALQRGLPFILTLMLFMAFWLALLRVAEQAGLVQWVAKHLEYPLKWLFPEVPLDHPAHHAIVMNLSANMIGISNAATPLGLKAMHYLDELNNHSEVASHSMCTLLALNTSSIQLIPASTIAFLIAAGATHPTLVMYTSFLATMCSTLAAIISVKSVIAWDNYQRARELRL